MPARLLPFLATFLWLSQSQAQPEQKYQLHFYNGQQAYSEALASTDFSRGISMDAWFRFDPDTEKGQLLGFGPGTGVNNPPPDFGRTHVLRVIQDQLVFSILNGPANGPGSAEASVSVTYTPPESQWVHFAATYDNQTLRVYANGVLLGSNSSAGIIKSLGSRFYVGHQFRDGFRGNVRAIHVWKRGLTAGEIQALATNQVKAGDADLVANWPLDEGSGIVVGDRTAGLSRTSTTMDSMIFLWWARRALPIRSMCRFASS